MIGAGQEAVAPVAVELGRVLADWCRGLLLPLVDDPSVLTVVPRWDAPDVVTLVVRAARGHDLGRIIGARGARTDSLRTLAQAVGARHGLRRVDVEVVER